MSEEEFEANKITMLTDISVAYLKDAEAFIADLLFPKVDGKCVPQPPRPPWKEPLEHRELMALTGTTDLAQLLLVRHKPVDPGYSFGSLCHGCDYDGYEGEPPQWPCSTVRLIAEQLGHPFPKRDWE